MCLQSKQLDSSMDTLEPQAARRLATDWTARVRSRVAERWRFFFSPSCLDWSSSKMSIETFLGVYTAERRASLVPRLWICGPLHPQPPWAFMSGNGNTFIFTPWCNVPRRCYWSEALFSGYSHAHPTILQISNPQQNACTWQLTKPSRELAAEDPQRIHS